MRTAIFILCLGYLLFGGYNYLYTGRDHNSYSSRLHLEKNHQSKFTDNKQKHPVVKETGAAQQEASLQADIEDEDNNDPAGRKYKLLAKFLSALSYSVILTWLYRRFKTPRVFSNISCKYITQRVLRI